MTLLQSGGLIFYLLLTCVTHSHGQVTRLNTLVETLMQIKRREEDKERQLTEPRDQTEATKTMLKSALLNLSRTEESLTLPNSKIILTATPSTITDELTETLTVRCSLQDTTSNNDTLHVSSIVIEKVKEEGQLQVARVVFEQSPVAGPEGIGASIAGSLTNEQNYLEVTWTPPQERQSGRYICEINTLNTLDLSSGTTKYRSYVDVDYKGLSVQDLKGLVMEAKNEIVALEKRIRTPHSEEGIVYCERSEKWQYGVPYGATYKEVVKDVSFKTPYVELPVVDVSVVRLDVDHSKNTRYAYEIRNLTTSGFQVACMTWADTYVMSMFIRWTSILA